VKYYITDFNEKLSRKSTFGYNCINIWGTLHEDLTKYGLLFRAIYEGWNFNSGNYLFTTDTK